MRRIALTAALVAVLAGCGGEKPATDGWAARADAACGRALHRIQTRGWPDDVKELQTIAPDVADDVRGAIEAIRRVPAPNAAARPFLANLDDLEPMLDDVTQATVAMDLVRLPRTAKRLEDQLWTLEATAKRAGLRRCFATARPAWVADGIRAPVVAEQLASMDRELGHMLSRRRGTTHATLSHLAKTLGLYERGLLALSPPGRATPHLDAYRTTVQKFQWAAAGLAVKADDGKLVAGPALKRRIASLAAGMKVMERRFQRSLTAAPVTRAPEPDSEAAS